MAAPRDLTTAGALGSWKKHSDRQNLPADLTRFVGREPETAEVKRLLASTRLLTLAGSAGVGKTRLALRVASAVVNQFRDGVWLVEFAPIADPTLVAKSVALTLTVPEQRGRSMTASLCDALRVKQILLVLDNCEHLVQAIADLANTLLRECAELRILATSRQTLHVPGETTWRVPSMTIPAAAGRLFGDSLASYDATRLFAERAMSALPSFVVTEQNASTITRICAQLDGIPLAIELAAARVSVLGIDQIEERLKDRFRLLTGGSRTALPRQQTLRATLDWSYSLLSEDERVLFRRLAVFAGGWTLEAAEALYRDEGADVLDLLAGLVDKSLVICDESGQSKRYRLLETMRDYGWEKLRAAGAGDVVRGRQLEWLLVVAEEGDRQIRGNEQAKWLALLEREHDNLRAGLAWSIGRGHDPEAALCLAGSMAWFWRIHGHLSEGRRWLAGALGAPGAEASTARPRALNGAGLLANSQSDSVAAKTLLEESLRLARSLGDGAGAAWALHGLGRVAEWAGDFAGAEAALEESLAYFRDRNDIAGETYSNLHLANVARDQEQYVGAADLYAKTVTAARSNGDSWVAGWALAHQANLTIRQDNLELTAQLLREGLALLSSIQATWGIATCLNGLAGIAGAQDRPDRAARLFGAEQSFRADLGTPPAFLVHPAYQRGLSAARVTLGDEQFEQLSAEGRAMSLGEAVRYALEVENPTERTGKRDQSNATPNISVPLTPREREIAVLIARGRSNREIAGALVITLRTADTNVMNVFTKLGFHARAQVAAWAVSHNLLPKDT